MQFKSMQSVRIDIKIKLERQMNFYSQNGLIFGNDENRFFIDVICKNCFENRHKIT